MVSLWEVPGSGGSTGWGCFTHAVATGPLSAQVGAGLAAAAVGLVVGQRVGLMMRQWVVLVVW